ncbi:MAG TPA: PCRF domain-containing protein, partial [Candidatus Cloacimonadota bacterium]|nr:PCRF domain-containing protein [Candidatus Cloacimonadota bacterium]
MLPVSKLQALAEEHEQLQGQVSDASLMSDARKYRDLMRRYKELTAITDCWQRYQSIDNELMEARHILESESDHELIQMAKEEIGTLSEKLDAAEQELRELLIPGDPNDEKNAIIEIRAGTGGEEAALFVADLYRMYSYYAEQKGWKKQLIDSSETGLGG